MKCTAELRTNMGGVEVIIRRFISANGYRIMLVWVDLSCYSYIEMNGSKDLSWNQAIKYFDEMYKIYGGDLIEV